jgi:hypothetical protein
MNHSPSLETHSPSATKSITVFNLTCYYKLNTEAYIDIDLPVNTLKPLVIFHNNPLFKVRLS